MRWCRDLKHPRGGQANDRRNGRHESLSDDCGATSIEAPLVVVERRRSERVEVLSQSSQRIRSLLTWLSKGRDDFDQTDRPNYQGARQFVSPSCPITKHGFHRHGMRTARLDLNRAVLIPGPPLGSPWTTRNSPPIPVNAHGGTAIHTTASGHPGNSGIALLSIFSLAL